MAWKRKDRDDTEGLCFFYFSFLGIWLFFTTSMKGRHSESGCWAFSWGNAQQRQESSVKGGHNQAKQVSLFEHSSHMRWWVPIRENWKTKFTWTIKHQAQCVVLYYYYEHLKILTCYSWKDNWWNILKRCFVFICRWLTLKFLQKICMFIFFIMLRLIFWILVFLFLWLFTHSLKLNMKNLLHLHLPDSHYCTHSHSGK